MPIIESCASQSLSGSGVGGRVRHGAAAAGGAPVRELDQRQDQPVERGGAEREGEAQPVLAPGDPRGPVAGDVQAEHDGAHGEEGHGVHGRGAQPLAHHEEREEHRERELRRDEDRGGGHGQVREPVGVDEVVRARGHAEARGGQQYARRGEQGRGAPVARAAQGVGRRHGEQQQRPAAGLQPRGEPLPVAALAEVEAAEERPAYGAQREHPDVERHQEAVHRLAARRRRRRRVLARFHVHGRGELLRAPASGCRSAQDAVTHTGEGWRLRSA
ncbi:hypothetical protein PVAP13_2KG368905 [Panicum virgatum]|uniref:Uncharacterized protein n=1 Tax=Panicum virgatum TaxID=38727 RepID=A0A8T0W8D8_PANVG|nr:hypothetical protein PVAP13_2KG368905 [Panicum virgatum]